MEKIDTSKFKQIRNDKHVLRVPRSNLKKEIDFLNQHPNVIKRDNHSLVWLNLNRAQVLIKNSFKNIPVIIVGKGPSLDNLRPNMIPEDCIVFLCNDAYSKLDVPNQKFGIQMDMSMLGIYNDPDINRIITPSVLKYYNMYSNTFMLTQTLLKIHRICPVGQLACYAANWIGCSPIILIGFDGAFGGSCDYAKKIGYPSKRGGAPLRFRKHKAYIEKALGEAIYAHVPIESKARKSIISDSIQQLQDNLQSPCVEKDSQPQVDYRDTEDSVLDMDISQTESPHDHSDNLQQPSYHEYDNQKSIHNDSDQATI